MSTPAFMKSPYFVLDQAEEFMDYLRDGWHFDVLCRSGAYLRNSYWYGEWVVVLVSPDEKQEIPLLKARDGGAADDMRLFTVAAGRQPLGMARRTARLPYLVQVSHETQH